MNPVVDPQGKWIFDGDPIQGLQQLAHSSFSLPVLDLSNVPLDRLPKCLPKITGLQELYLHRNGLSQLPNNLGDIPKLRLLSLGKNNISTLPDSMRQRWDSFEILFLGDNNFTENPIDEEWMTMFKQGSIGNNPIPEPISPFWMTKQDAKEFPERISMLFLDTSIDDTIRQPMIDQALSLLRLCPEPMIYEALLKDVWIEQTETDTIIHWNAFLQQPHLIPLRNHLLSLIPRGSLVHPTLLNNRSL